LAEGPAMGWAVAEQGLVGGIQGEVWAMGAAVNV
jgi:hypothetical protein